jgi:glycosyltransferase involved in cell wall biosynthesis
MRTAPNDPSPQPTVLVGHPFAPIGMGEQVRSTFRAMRAAQVPVQLLDVFGVPSSDADLCAELKPFLTDRVGPGSGVFCINGDEVERVLGHLGERAAGEKRIIYPAWELPRYPAEWAGQLERFDEVWSASAYTYASIRASVSTPVHHLPLATQPHLPRAFGRRSFGIPEACYAFLLFFDFRSYIERKNPYAALEAFRRVAEARPGLDLRLVAKINSFDVHLERARAFLDRIRPFGDRVIVLDRTLTDAEVKALHVCCDAFISLHRCEGYGFGLAEAMYFGKPTAATGYSGNMDFMNSDTAHLLGYRLVPIPEGEYPHAAGQVWADPDVEQAATVMTALADDPERGRALGVAASRHMRVHFSYRAIGLRYAARLAVLAPGGALPAAPEATLPPPAEETTTSSAEVRIPVSARMGKALAAAEDAAKSERIVDVLAPPLRTRSARRAPPY